MDKKRLLTTLTDIGLTENEALVYLSALSLGSSPILKIARGSGLKRTTVYSVVESLKQKGLMNIEVKGFKQLFAAEDPQKLDALLASRHAHLTQTLPELSALYNLRGGESLMKYYEGLRGVRSVYDKILTDLQPHDDYMVVTDQEHFVGLEETYVLDFIKRLSKLNIHQRLLMQDSPTAREHKKNAKAWNREIKILPKGTKLLTDLVIIPHYVVTVQIPPPITTIVIENKSVVQMHRELFEIIWKSLPE